MGFRFRKSIRLFPGVRINLSTRGVSTSIGAAPFTVNIGRRGVRSTASIPGTGLSYSQLHNPSGKGADHQATAPSAGGGAWLVVLLIAGGMVWALAALGSRNDPVASPPPVVLATPLANPSALDAGRRPSAAPVSPLAPTPQTASTSPLRPAPGPPLQLQGASPAPGPSSSATKPAAPTVALIPLPMQLQGAQATPAPSASTLKPKSSQPAASNRQAQQKPKGTMQNRPRAKAASTAACPCSSARNCTGPRGGRYCVTSGGNRRYR